jgi:hypothetical protein
MNIRQHGILALTLGSTLALGASTANARVLEPNSKTAHTSASKSSRYWQVVKNHSGETYLGARTNALHPDDRSGIRGA